MPEAIIPLLIAVGTTVAEKTIGGGGSSSTDLQKQIAEQQAQQKAQQDSVTKEAVLHNAPSIQAQLGGAVAPDYYISEATREAGAAGDENVARQALQGFLGLSAPSGTGEGGFSIPNRPEQGQPNFIEDLLTRFGGGGTDTGTSGGYV